MPKIIDGSAMIQRVRELYEKGKVDLPYYNIVKEAVQMEPALKAQEPVEPKKLMAKDKNGYRWRFYCGKCGGEIDRLDKCCRHCGSVVKWE